MYKAKWMILTALAVVLVSCGQPLVPGTQIVEEISEDRPNYYSIDRRMFPQDNVVCYTYREAMECLKVINDQPK